MKIPAPSHHPGYRAWLQVGGLLAVVVAVVSVGYAGFRAFVSAPDLHALNLYLLAAVGGVASFFSPCAFPLLPGYLSFYHLAGQKEGHSRRGAGHAFKLGLAAALGVVTFALILGLLMAALGTGIAQGLSISGPQPSPFVRLFRGGVGAVLLVLGVGQLAGWNLKPAVVDAFAYHTRPQREGERSLVASLYLYGLGYNAAGMGCTGPILAGLMIAALASGGFAATLGAFIVFASTMGGLMLLISGLVAASHRTMIVRLKAAAPKIKKVASFLLIGVGLFNLYTAFNLDLFLRLLFPQ